jgi:hypothetical protein
VRGEAALRPLALWFAAIVAGILTGLSAVAFRARIALFHNARFSFSACEASFLCARGRDERPSTRVENRGRDYLAPASGAFGRRSGYVHLIRTAILALRCAPTRAGPAYNSETRFLPIRESFCPVLRVRLSGDRPSIRGIGPTLLVIRILKFY